LAPHFNAGVMPHPGQAENRQERVPVAAEGKVYLASEDGVVTVLQAGHNGTILSQFDTRELIRATPALLDGRVFVRTAQSISAFGERAPVTADRH